MVRIRESAVPLMFAGALFGGVAGGVVGGITDRGASEGIHRQQIYVAADGKQHSITLGIARTQLDLANVALVDAHAEADHSVAGFLDETCREAIAPYRAGGRFADVSETDVVLDLGNEPTLPCQKDPSQLRGIVRSVREVDQPVVAAYGQVEEWQATTSEFIGFDADDKRFHAWLPGAVVGAIAGVISGLREFRLRQSTLSVEHAVAEPAVIVAGQ